MGTKSRGIRPRKGAGRGPGGRHEAEESRFLNESSHGRDLTTRRGIMDTKSRGIQSRKSDGRGPGDRHEADESRFLNESSQGRDLTTRRSRKGDGHQLLRKVIEAVREKHGNIFPKHVEKVCQIIDRNGKDVLEQFLKLVAPSTVSNFSKSEMNRIVTLLSHIVRLDGDSGNWGLLQNLQACFATTSFELEQAANQVQLKLKRLAEMDTSPEDTFKRFASKSTNKINVEGFNRMLKLSLRDNMDQFSSSEIRYGLFRYIDPVGLDGVDLDGFRQFISSKVADPVYEHGTWPSNNCLQTNPRVVVDICVMGRNPTVLEKMELIEDGFERAQGVNFGVWVKLQRPSDFENHQAFQRARITDVLCTAPGKVKNLSKLERALLVMGFTPAKKPATKRKSLLSKLSQKSTNEVMVWVRRKSDDDAVVFNIFFGDRKHNPPCNDYKLDLSALTKDHYYLQNPNFFVRKLVCGKDTGLQGLAKEFDMISSAHETGKRKLLKKQLEHQRSKKILALKQDIRKQLLDIFFQHMKSDPLAQTLLNTDALLHEADKKQVGWITTTAVKRLFKKCGLTFSDKETLELLSRQLCVHHEDRVPVTKIEEMLMFNPATVQLLLLEICKSNPRLVVEFCHNENVRNVCKEKTFLGHLTNLSKGTQFEYMEWELEPVVQLFKLSSKQGETLIDMAAFVELLHTVFDLLRRAPQDDGQVKEEENRTHPHPRELLIQEFSQQDVIHERYKSFFRKNRPSQVSLARLKSEFRKRTLREDDIELDSLLEETGLGTLRFIGPDDLHKAAFKLYGGASKHPQDDTSSSGFDSSSDEDDSDGSCDLFPYKEQQTMPKMHKHEWADIRKAMNNLLLDFVLSSNEQRIRKNDFVSALSRAGVRLTNTKLEKIVQYCESKTGSQYLDRVRLLKALWPSQSIEVQPYFRLDNALERARLVIKLAERKGVDRERIRTDIFLYGLDTQENGSHIFQPRHLVRLLRRLLSDASVVDEDEDELVDRLRTKLGRSTASLLDAVTTFFLESECDTTELVALAEQKLVKGLELASFDPIRRFRELDKNGDGLVTKADFNATLHKLVPSMRKHDIDLLALIFSSQDGTLVKYTGDFEHLCTQRPSWELSQVYDLVYKIRAYLQKRLRRREKSFHHHWKLFRDRDIQNRGVLSRTQFRAVLCDDLEIFNVISEDNLRLIMRWCQSHDDLIDYQRFCRTVAPAKAQIESILDRVAKYVHLVSLVGGGQVDLRRAFAPVDLYGTGFASRESFVETCRKLGLITEEVLSEADLQLLLDDLDLNGEDTVDYIRFASSVRCRDLDETHQERVTGTIEAFRRHLLTLPQELQNGLEFHRYDKLHDGLITEENFLQACYAMYVPCSSGDLLECVDFLGRRDIKLERIAYQGLLEDIIRAGGPGGLTSQVSHPVSAVPSKGSDPVWNSGVINSWLGSKKVKGTEKEQFLEVYKSIERHRAQISTVDNSSQMTTTQDGDSQRDAYNRTGYWLCNVCRYNNNNFRYESHCSMCSSDNPFV